MLPPKTQHNYVIYSFRITKPLTKHLHNSLQHFPNNNKCIKKMRRLGIILGNGRKM